LTLSEDMPILIKNLFRRAMRTTFSLIITFSSLFLHSLDSPAMVIRELVNANYGHESSYKSRDLYILDNIFLKKLRDEVLELIEVEKPSNVAKHNHVTNWAGPIGVSKQFSLLNNSGRFDDTSSDHNKSKKGKAFHHKERYPTLARFIEFFPDAINFRANVFGSNSGLKQHKEDIVLVQSSGTPGLRVRFHLPIKTNKDVLMFVGGNYYHFNEGVLYFFHNGCVHAAHNHHNAQDRVHLVWDMLLTEDTYNRMFGGSIAGPHMHFLGNIPTSILKRGPIEDHSARRSNISIDLAEKIKLCSAEA
jgi:hypothetical protein